MEELALQEVDRCWNAPEKAVLVTSVDSAGRPNMIAIGWLMRASMTPPVYAVGINRRSLSGRNILASGEFTIGVPGTELAEALIYCGTHTGTEVDKFAHTGLTPLPARTVKAPLIAQCLANLECRVIAVQEIGDHRVFFGQLQACWLDEARRGARTLLIIGPESGYQTAYKSAGFRLGTVKE